MTAAARLDPEFVELMPAIIEPGYLYISMEYRITAHSCACGCGEKITLTLHPAQWSLLFDGEHVSLRPSVGNAGTPCRSHYYITRNEIDWYEPLTDESIEVGKSRDRAAINATETRSPQTEARPRSWWRRLLVRE